MEDSTYDYMTDNSPAIILHALRQDCVPDYITGESLPALEEVQGLAKVAFANTEKRLYPCHTKAATWLSAAYLAGSGTDDEDVKAFIQKQASLFDIENDVEEIGKSYLPAILEKSACNETQEIRHAIRLNTGTLEDPCEQDFYPVTGVTELSKSASQATEDYRRGALPYPLFLDVAQEIKKEAKAQDCEYVLTREINTVGEDRMPDFVNALYAMQVGKREQYLEKYSSVINEAAEAADNMESPEDIIKLAKDVASELWYMDRENGVSYSSCVLNPYEAIFTGPTLKDFEKAATTHFLLSGVFIPTEELVHASAETIDTVFGEKTASAIKEAQELCSGELSLVKTSAASEILSCVSKESQDRLLRILYDGSY